MFDFLFADNTFKDYPAQTIIHQLQGLGVGILLIKAHVYRHWHFLGYAAIATVCFIAYETLEQARIADRGDADVLNFTVMVHAGAIATIVYHYLRRKIHDRRNSRASQTRGVGSDSP